LLPFRAWRPRRIQEWIEAAIEVPMVILSILFLALALVDATVTLRPGQSRLIALVQWVIWTIFAIEFVVMFALAHDKRAYLRRNWLAAFSVLLPFLRVFRALRALRALRTLRLFRLLALTGRASRQAGAVLEARGVGYVALVTLLVTLAGGAGMYLVERGVPESRFRSLGDALWWSAASITTVGADLAPVTAEGRILALAIYIFGMAVIGYITAVLASYFVGKEMAPPQVTQLDREITETADEDASSVEELQAKVDRLIALMERRADEQRRGQSTWQSEE